MTHGGRKQASLEIDGVMYTVLNNVGVEGLYTQTLYCPSQETGLGFPFLS